MLTAFLKPRSALPRRLRTTSASLRSPRHAEKRLAFLASQKFALRISQDPVRDNPRLGLAEWLPRRMFTHQSAFCRLSVRSQPLGLDVLAIGLLGAL